MQECVLLAAFRTLPFLGILELRAVADLLAAAQPGARGRVHRDGEAAAQLPHDVLLSGHLVREVVLGGPVEAEDVNRCLAPGTAQDAEQPCGYRLNLFPESQMARRCFGLRYTAAL